MGRYILHEQSVAQEFPDSTHCFYRPRQQVRGTPVDGQLPENQQGRKKDNRSKPGRHLEILTRRDRGNNKN